MPNAKLEIVDKPLSELKTRRSNPRTHGKMQVRKIADSIQKFGFVTPVLVDGDNVIIAGHGRLEAAKLLGLKSVPTLMVDHLTPAEIKAYVIADNKLASLAGWDKKLLALEIAEIAELDVDFDLTVTGFDIAELALLSDTAASQASRAAGGRLAIRRWHSRLASTESRNSGLPSAFRASAGTSITLSPNWLMTRW